MIKTYTSQAVAPKASPIVARKISQSRKTGVKVFEIVRRIEGQDDVVLGTVVEEDAWNAVRKFKAR